MRYEEFYTRIIARAGLGHRDITRQVKVIIDTLEEAVSPGEIKDVLHSLPRGYEALF